MTDEHEFRLVAKVHDADARKALRFVEDFIVYARRFYGIDVSLDGTDSGDVGSTRNEQRPAAGLSAVS